jgi:hypothetical protein
MMFLLFIAVGGAYKSPEMMSGSSSYVMYAILSGTYFFFIVRFLMIFQADNINGYGFLAAIVAVDIFALLGFLFLSEPRKENDRHV